jgi:hypothetical protein
MYPCRLPARMAEGAQEGEGRMLPAWMLAVSTGIGISILMMTPSLSEGRYFLRAWLNFLGLLLLFSGLPLFFRFYHCIIPRVFRGQARDERRLSDVEPVLTIAT